MAALKLQFTDAGLEKLISAKSLGLKGEISHIAFGDGAYTPSRSQLTLLRECERVAISDYQGDGRTLRMAAVFDNPLEYAIREIGVFLSDGTLLGVYSKESKTLGYRSPNVKVVQWFTVNIEPLPTDSINVVVGYENVNLVFDQPLAILAKSHLTIMQRQVQQSFCLLELVKKINDLGRDNVIN
ncbi:phage tail protein [Zooshikella sp. RANM57]|uniref:phage tail-collar fiber domain-containing protein n=1 Tax=Zooshikella sp. RANM57 TaxID=3425863 RepID=UPI003D6E31FA